MSVVSPHKNDILASNVLFSGLAFSISIRLVRVLILHRDQELSTPIIIMGSIMGYLFCAAMYVAIRRGRPWGKVTLVIVFLLTAGIGFFYYKTTLYSLRTDVLFAIGYGVGWVVQLWAFVLLFGRSRRQAF